MKLTSLICATLLLFTGCTTTQNNSFSPEFVQYAVDDAVGIYAALRYPENKDALLKAKAALDNLVAHEYWNVNAFVEALAAANIRGIEEKDFELYIMPGITLLSLFLNGHNIDVNQTPYARAIILGADKALTRVVK